MPWIPNQGPFPRPELPGVHGTTSLSATPDGPSCPSRESGRRSQSATEGGFPCCVGSPHADMPPPLPRRDRWIKSLAGRRIPADHPDSSGDGLPRDIDGSAPTTKISGPHRMFTFVAAYPLAGPPSGPLHRRLRRLRHLHRRSDCYRLERLSCRAGISPAEDPSLSTAHNVPFFSGFAPLPG